MTEYNSEAFDLVHKLHGLIESQQKEIKKLQSQVRSLRSLNEKLTRERDDLKSINSRLLVHPRSNYRDTQTQTTLEA